jgi:predicted nucleic acid-binding protein
MIAYLDSSVIMRWIFKSPDVFIAGPDIEGFTTSVLLRVECLRAIDRVRIAGEITADEAAECFGGFHARIRTWNFFPLTDEILDTASVHMTVAVATLDAIHIASALHLKKSIPDNLIFVTHDRTQTAAARAMGLEVTGA